MINSILHFLRCYKVTKLFKVDLARLHSFRGQLQCQLVCHSLIKTIIFPYSIMQLLIPNKPCTILVKEFKGKPQILLGKLVFLMRCGNDPLRVVEAPVSVHISYCEYFQNFALSFAPVPPKRFH